MFLQLLTPPPHSRSACRVSALRMAEGGGDRSFEDRHRQYACFENWVMATFPPEHPDRKVRPHRRARRPAVP